MEISQLKRGPILFFEVTGSLTPSDAQVFCDTVAANPHYGRVAGVLIHLQKIEWKLTAAEIEGLARNAQLRSIQWAIVAEGDFSFGVAQQFVRQTPKGPVFKTFRDEESAIQWLLAPVV